MRAAEGLREALIAQLDELDRLEINTLLTQRSQRYRAIGAFA